MRKRRRTSEHKRAKLKKTGVIDNARPKWLSAVFAKIKMELWDTDSNHENDTDSSYSLSDFDSESDGSDQDIY